MTMRSLFAASILIALSTAASAMATRLEGPVTGGVFGMSGSDYYGDVRSQMPFTQEAAPRPAGIAAVERERASRRRAKVAALRLKAGRIVAGRRSPHG